MRRGELYQVPMPGGRTRTLLIVGNDDVTAISKLVQCVEIDTAGVWPETILTVRLTHPVDGVARCAEVGPYLKSLFNAAESLGRADEQVMERIGIALNVVFNLE